MATRKSVRLARADLITLRVDWERYAEIGYEQTQLIGAAIAHLGFDGLIAPSARWPCENVMVFVTNHLGDDELATVIETKQVDWRAWARAHAANPHRVEISRNVSE